MKKNNIARLGAISKMTLPAHIRSEIERGQRTFAKDGKFKVIDCFSSAPHGMSTNKKMQDYRDRMLNGKQMVTKQTRGQPPMVERLRTVSIIVDHLESIGVPFGVCPNSQMNKLVRKFLNDEAALTTDARKSRRKKIAPGAVRSVLREVRMLRQLGTVFIQLRPYV